MSSAVQSPQGGALVRFPPPLVFLGFLLAGWLLHYAVWPLRFPLARWMTLGIGAFAFVGAIALFGSAMRWFRATDQRPTPWLPSPSLIVQGPYRFSRNPIYVAMALMQC